MTVCLQDRRLPGFLDVRYLTAYDIAEDEVFRLEVLPRWIGLGEIQDACESRAVILILINMRFLRVGCIVRCRPVLKQKASIKLLQIGCGEKGPCSLGVIFGMPNARTHCPYCNSRAVIDLAKVLHHRGVAFFLCRTCRDIWHVREDQNGPPSRDLLRLKTLEVDTKCRLVSPKLFRFLLMMNSLRVFDSSKNATACQRRNRFDAASGFGWESEERDEAGAETGQTDRGI